LLATAGGKEGEDSSSGMHKTCVDGWNLLLLPAAVETLVEASDVAAGVVVGWPTLRQHGGDDVTSGCLSLVEDGVEAT
jgi:hypothetical protein